MVERRKNIRVLWSENQMQQSWQNPTRRLWYNVKTGKQTPLMERKNLKKEKSLFSL